MVAHFGGSRHRGGVRNLLKPPGSGGSELPGEEYQSVGVAIEHCVAAVPGGSGGRLQGARNERGAGAREVVADKRFALAASDSQTCTQAARQGTASHRPKRATVGRDPLGRDAVVAGGRTRSAVGGSRADKSAVGR